MRHRQRADGPIAHGLRQTGEGVGQPRPVIHRGQRVGTDDFIQLLVDFGLDLRAVGQQQQRPVDGLRRRVRAGDQQIHAQVIDHVALDLARLRLGQHHFHQAYRGRQVEAGAIAGPLHQGIDDGRADFRLPDGLLDGIVGQELHPGNIVGQVRGVGVGEYPVDVFQQRLTLFHELAGAVFVLPKNGAEHHLGVATGHHHRG